MKNLILAVVALFFAGCVTGYSRVENVRFSKVNLSLDNINKQHANKYQTREEMANGFSVCIANWLKEQNLLNQNSQYELNVYISYQRRFEGSSSRLGPPKYSGSFIVLKDGKPERSVSTGPMAYNPGYVGDLKSMANQNGRKFEDIITASFCDYAKGKILDVIGKNEDALDTVER